MQRLLSKICLATTLCLSFHYCFADEIPKGVVIGKSLVKNTLNIRNEDTGNRHTYFLDDKTHITSNGSLLTLEDIQPGHQVFLNFTKTGNGRELNLIRIPNLDDILQVASVDNDEDLFISGTITGLRPTKRTITIQGPRLNLHRTLHVPESVAIKQNDKLVKFNSLKVGDLIEFRHHETEQGLIVISGEVRKKEQSNRD